ncbi:hypothetical protein K469DRAFT_666063 [Zopfia rhizophila CBS 207.26]|uniref:Ubiquitin-like-conjugating enzyme ATG10 n=1 Tax=Zopfia rhizophila CBS 207.26 TaxID=1314779 RepID=A0A6A6E5J6_9PEZI|nr:hypothetical protein K469DRAFT_666063 [Zopfia rhizophila CBS 207.26]
MEKIASFPSISEPEFEKACNCLLEAYKRYNHLQSDWLLVDFVHNDDSKYLKILKALSITKISPKHQELRIEETEIEEDDEEALVEDTKRSHEVILEYNIILSPSYQVPVLYFSIKDPHFRFPPTRDTLYSYIVPHQFKLQVESVGIIGGITLTDHPFTNSPVFFIHPCQTTSVLEASLGSKEATPEEYLNLWIGAMGGCAGLFLPRALLG